MSIDAYITFYRLGDRAFLSRKNFSRLGMWPKSSLLCSTALSTHGRSRIDLGMNALLATGHLPLWLLVAGLFLPRLSLAIAWIISAYPPNGLADLLNFVLWLFVPRFLMAFYIYTDAGPNNLW